MTANLASADVVPSNADSWKTWNIFTRTITVQNTTQLKFKTENNQTIRKSNKPQSWFTLSALKACLVEHFLVCSQPLHWVHSFLAGLTLLLLWCSPAPNSLFTKYHSNQLSLDVNIHDPCWWKISPGADPGGGVDWVASHPPLWGRLSLKLWKGTELSLR